MGMTPEESAGVAETVHESGMVGVPDEMQRLWTPHRMVYIKDQMQPEDDACPFCRAPELGDEQALIVARGELAYVLLNLYPYNTGHLLVCPYRHISTYDQASPAEVAEIGALDADGDARPLVRLGLPRVQSRNESGRDRRRRHCLPPASAHRAAVALRCEFLSDHRQDEVAAAAAR